MKKQIEICELWKQLIDKGNKPKKLKNYEIIDAHGIKVLSKDGKYININWLSRHKTNKHMLKVNVKAKDIGKYVIVTTDHICMVYNRNHFFENANAKSLKIGNLVSIWNEEANEELVGEIVSIEDLGLTEEYVYDLEVDDKSHAFYANDILIHNSQFVNLQVVTDWLRAQNDWPELLQDWSADQKRALWDTMDKFVKEEVNPFVRNLVNKYCKSSETAPLVYELEYMGDVGVYESKKHYAIHKIFNEGDAVDKTKYTGIELKKGTVPKEMKTFLADIYAGVL